MASTASGLAMTKGILGLVECRIMSCRGPPELSSSIEYDIYNFYIISKSFPRLNMIEIIFLHNYVDDGAPHSPIKIASFAFKSYSLFI